VDASALQIPHPQCAKQAQSEQVDAEIIAMEVSGDKMATTHAEL
jgi:hypothetical protein